MFTVIIILSHVIIFEVIDTSLRYNAIYVYKQNICFIATFLQDGLTAVLVALQMENKDLVTCLIENGADINTPSVNVRKSTI